MHSAPFSSAYLNNRVSGFPVAPLEADEIKIKKKLIRKTLEVFLLKNPSNSFSGIDGSKIDDFVNDIWNTTHSIGIEQLKTQADELTLETNKLRAQAASVAHVPSSLGILKPISAAVPIQPSRLSTENSQDFPIRNLKRKSIPANDEWFGEELKGKYPRNGKHVFSNGNWFEGELKDGLSWNGKGKRIFPNGGQFDGEVKDGICWNGQGKQIFPNGGWFDGTWKEGKWWNGESKITVNRVQYERTWKEGIPTNKIIPCSRNA